MVSYFYIVDLADVFLIASFSLVIVMAMPTSPKQKEKLNQY